jgi:peptidoglycan/LPS O-acetylase OafA/YrhL
MVPTAVSQSSFRSNSANLDLVRAVAVLSVFFPHLYAIAYHAPQTTMEWHFGQLGVLTFFVHTSLVLMLSLERATRSGNGLFGNFYVRRAFRLYPLSIFCVLLAMVCNYSPNWQSPVRVWTMPEFLSNVLLTMNLTYTDVMVGGLWTLPLEVQMYAMLPFLFLLCRRTGSAAVLFGVWLVSLPLSVAAVSVSGRLTVFDYAPCFLAGVIAYKLSLLVRRRFPGWAWPLAFFASAAVFFAGTHETERIFRFAYTITLGFAIPWFQEFEFRPLQLVVHYVAKYSYGIYLSHVAVMMFCFSSAVPGEWRWPLFTALMLVAPVAAFHGIEQPFINLGQRLSNAWFPPAGERFLSEPGNAASRQ